MTLAGMAAGLALAGALAASIWQAGRDAAAAAAASKSLLDARAAALAFAATDCRARLAGTHRMADATASLPGFGGNPLAGWSVEIGPHGPPQVEFAAAEDEAAWRALIALGGRETAGGAAFDVHGGRRAHAGRRHFSRDIQGEAC